MRFELLFLSVFAVPTVVVACSSTVDTTTKSGHHGGGAGGTAETTGGGGAIAGGGAGGDNGGPSNVYPAPHPAAPQIVQLGGPILAAPKIYPVFFGGDDPMVAAQIADFVSKVGGTAYWSANVSEYGVGAASGQPPIQLSETAPATLDDSAIKTWLEGKLNANDPAFPAPDSNTLIALFYPSGVTITQNLGSKQGISCTQFGGYHDSITLDAAHAGKYVPYAVIPRCSEFDGLTGIDAVTGGASHEFIEAATDPYPLVDPAWAQPDSQHIYWLFGLGGEIADMCAQSPTSFTKFPELDYVVQRAWSNKSAKASHDPCVPILPGVPYFNSAPIFTDMLTLGGGAVSVPGVQIGVGQTKTIDIALFSDAATNGPWTVAAIDYSDAMGGPPQLKFAFDRTSGQNGEKLHLSITVLTASPYGAELFYLVSSLGIQLNFWVGIVGN